MNREIKFRAWDSDLELMMPEVDLSQALQHYKWLGRKDLPLIQYTGVKDKNGKEIYENDYLEIPEESDNSKTWCVFWGSGKYILQNISTGDILDCNETNTRNKTIIGNTFESPREHKAVASDL